MNIYQLFYNIPGIYPALINTVDHKIEQFDTFAILIDPAFGRPYKIFALESYYNNISYINFMAMSVPARFIRFMFTIAIVNIIKSVLSKIIRGNANIILFISISVFWVSFYIFIFGEWQVFINNKYIKTITIYIIVHLGM